ncbi:MAG: M1 family metallopeptidase [Bacteroidetes bacterium]|nr:M1 family metallopeptidase [Bacteroidota bacterium]
MFRFAIVPLIILLSFSGFAQNFEINEYMPLNIREAVESGFRTPEGKPGKNYVMNDVAYKIDAELFPVEGVVKGKINIEYKNNFPKNLTKLVLRLYQDAFKKGVARDFQINPKDVHDGTVISDLKIDGVEIDLKSGMINRSGTLMTISLDSPLLSGAKVSLAMNWEAKIPEISRVRMGKYSDSTLFVAYWYPQMSVYDDLQGWDMQNYTMNQEFYNNFADFDVKVTVPEGFLVWATGELQNPSEVYSDAILDSWKKAMNSEKIVNIITNENKTALKTKKGKNTFYYKAKFVPDFAFASAVDYLWDASTMIVDKKTGRKAFVSAVYNENSEDFYQVADIAVKAINYFSEDLPGVPYPYPVMTVFNGQGGMEFPMMVNDGSENSYASAVGLTSHEIAHTYFPFFMGTNEVKYAFMDEGWARMIPYKFQKEVGKYNPVANQMKAFDELAGREFEVPPMVPSIQLKGQTYRMAAYNRPSLAYLFLQDIMGEEKFREAMRYYISLWNGKHPMPFDFFNTMSSFYGEDLSWYFKSWFFNWDYPDMTLKYSLIDGDKTKGKGAGDGEVAVVVENKGRLPLPVRIYEVNGDNKKLIYSKTALVWKEGRKSLNINLPVLRKGASYLLGDENVPDVNRVDNLLK